MCDVFGFCSVLPCFVSSKFRFSIPLMAGHSSLGRKIEEATGLTALFFLLTLIVCEFFSAKVLPPAKVAITHVSAYLLPFFLTCP